MRFIALAVAAIVASFSASPARALEFCVDGNTKLYAFLGAASHTAQYVRAQNAEGWKGVPVKIAAAVFKAAAKDHFHIPRCPTALERAVQALKQRPITRDDIQRILAETKAAAD